MKTKFDLEIRDEEGFEESSVSILGIASEACGFMLAGRLNRHIRTDFVKQKDFFLYNKSENDTDELECFYFEDKDRCYKYLLMETHNRFKSNIKQWDAYDFVLLIIGEDNLQHAKELIERLNSIDIVKILQILHPEPNVCEDNAEKKEGVQLNLLGEPCTTTVQNKKKRRILPKSVLESLLIDLDEYASQLWNN